MFPKAQPLYSDINTHHPRNKKISARLSILSSAKHNTDRWGSVQYADETTGTEHCDNYWLIFTFNAITLSNSKHKETRFCGNDEGTGKRWPI
jgi:hypothetical protein